SCHKRPISGPKYQKLGFVTTRNVDGQLEYARAEPQLVQHFSQVTAADLVRTYLNMGPTPRTKERYSCRKTRTRSALTATRSRMFTDRGAAGARIDSLVAYDCLVVATKPSRSTSNKGNRRVPRRCPGS